MTPENETKWDALEPSRGSFTFGNAARIVNHARGRGMSVRGHTLVRHSRLPCRVSGPGNPGDPGAACTAVHSGAEVWGDRFNGKVTITAGSSAISNWSVNVTVTPPQRVSATWNGSPTWDSSGNVMTMRPNGNGPLAAGASTSFGFTVMTNGNTAPRASAPAPRPDHTVPAPLATGRAGLPPAVT